MAAGFDAKHAVVIAGAGPTGMMLAAELALARVDVALVERRKSQDLAGSRAGGLQSRIIEILDQRGVAERFLLEGKAMQVQSFSTVPLDISDFPTRHNHGLALWQNHFEHFERILAGWIGELPVTVLRGCEVTGFAQDDTGVDVDLSDDRSLRTQYLIGCDGGHSLIRKKAGIDFPGWDPSTSYLIAEVEMTGTPAFGVRHDATGTYALGKLEDGRVRVVLREERVGPGDDPPVASGWLGTQVDLAAGLGPDEGHVPTQRPRRPLVATLAQHVVEPGGPQARITSERFVDAGTVGVAEMLAWRAGCAGVADSQHAAHHVGVNAELGGDGAHRCGRSGRHAWLCQTRKFSLTPISHAAAGLTFQRSPLAHVIAVVLSDER